MVLFEQWVVLAKQYGIFEYYLPFVILFSMFYGLLEKSNIFGKDARRLNFLISFSVAIYVMAYSPIGITLTQFFATFFTQTTIVLVTVLAFMMIIGMVTDEPMKKLNAKYIIPMGMLLAFGIFISSGGLNIFPGISTQMGSLGLSGEDISILGLIGLTLVVIYWITKEEKEEPTDKPKKRIV